MRDETATLSIDIQDGVKVVQFAGKKLLDEVSISEIGDQLTGMVAQADSVKFVLDFSKIEHMSSSALGMLITLHKRIRERSGGLCLIGIKPAIYEIFVITRLNEIFDIRQSTAEAIAALGE